MSRVRLVGVLFVALAGACSSGVDPELTVSVKPRSIANNGDVATITVEAVDSSGKPGTGTVRLTIDSVVSPDAITLANGTGTADYSCPAATCTPGKKTISAEWVVKGVRVTASTLVTVTDPSADAGSDAGVDAGTKTGGGAGGGGGATGGGSGGGGAATGGGSATGGGTGMVLDGGLTLTASKTKVYLGVGDSATLTATLLNGTAAVAGANVTFSTSLGGVAAPDAGTASAMYTATTNAQGIAVARFTETGTPGKTTISASSPATTQVATTDVEVLGVQQIQYVSTTCGSGACTIMGIKGSGFNEVATVRFKATDTANNPVVGLAVSFSIPSPPVGTTVNLSGFTDSKGEVVANVSAGLVIGAIQVKATVVPGSIEATSPTIGIRGATPSNKGFAFQCDLVNVAAYKAPVPPLPFTVPCRITLVDRYNNPVGTGTSVNLKSEAGTLTNSVATKAYSPSGDNTGEGTGVVNFSTLGTFPPVNVTPLAAVGSQYPYAREAEPSRVDGALIRNPRDGLVTIIAYVRGEEHFYDNNQNGVRDSDEPFIDQGEPFVDSNDNGIWDQGETYIDEAPADGKWNPPNGVWNNDTTIWVETHMLYTNYSDASVCSLTPSSFIVAKGTIVYFQAYMPDFNLNRVQAASTITSTNHTATKGGVTWNSNALQDSYGFQIERTLVEASTESECTPTTAICKWKTVFGQWGDGYVGDVKFTGALATDVTPSQADTLTVETTVLGVKVGTTASGTVQ